MMTYLTSHIDFVVPKFFFGLLIFVFSLLLPSCGSPDAPLDADIRQRIDSIAGVQTRQVQQETDSLCKLGRITLMPQLVDSIKRVRKREVEEQLRTIPRQ